MKNTCSLLIICLFALNAAAQNSGLYGKKTYIEFNGMGHVALVNQRGYVAELYGKTLSKKSDWLNGGFNVAAGIATRRDFMLGLEAGFWYFNVAGPDYLSDDDNYYAVSIRHEMLDVRTFSIIPTLTFGGKKGLLPIGLNHQVGLGYTRTKVLEKDYSYRPGSTFYTTQDELDDLHAQNGGFVDYEHVYTGVTAVYTLKVRIPVSKAVMINYGLRYTLNFTSADTGPSGNYKMHPQTLRSEIGTARFSSLLSLNIGLTLAL
jgi:hypothetical protein